MGRTSLESLGKRVQTRDQMPVYITWNVVEYRQAAERYVKAGDVVLEVRC